ncbi:MAG: phosphatidate cytidylyltransferase [Bacteroidales bacterium]
MNSLILRTITGSLFVLLVIGSMIWNPFVFAVIIGVFCAIGSYEYIKMIRVKTWHISSPSFFVFSLFIYIVVSLVALNIIHIRFLSLICLPLFGTLIQTLFRKTQNPIEEMGAQILGLVYIPLPMAMFNFLLDFQPNTGEYRLDIILGFFLLIWINDIFAYLTGSLIGRHKLFERISPKKTWEGSIGGGVFAVLFSCLFAWYFEDKTFGFWIGMAIVIVLTGSIGDLVESMIKRDLKIKDSGNIMPGHGGVLDRFDASIMAAPFVFIYLLFF